MRAYLCKALEDYYDQTASSSSSYYTYCFYSRKCYTINITRLDVKLTKDLLMDFKDGQVVNKRVQNFSRKVLPQDFNFAKFGGSQTILSYSTVNNTFWNMRLDGYLNAYLNRRQWNGPFGYTIGEVSYAIPSILRKYKASDLCWGFCRAVWVNQFRVFYLFTFLF